MNIEEIKSGLHKGNHRALAKAITLVESDHKDHISEASKLLTGLKTNGKCIRIAISGVPGVGKSSFIEKLGLYLTGTLNLKIAVLAIDPSSPISGGSILGDKTRMEELSKSPLAFIRPSPTSGSLGGVARKTRESILLCEAAGYDICLVETVGVGQSEYLAASMVDAFVMLHMPATGDFLQSMKKGILELTNILVITKADGPLKEMAGIAESEHKQSFHLSVSAGAWTPPVLKVSSKEGSGFDEFWRNLEAYINHQRYTGDFEKKRMQQSHAWYEDELLSQLKAYIKDHSKSEDIEKQAIKDLERGTYPAQVARNTLDLLLKNN